MIRGVDVDIADGEFCVLVGPSGCGKSTLLRMIAGLEEITDGEIAIGGKVVNRVPPKERDIAMVFQNYALYPHMTVRDNMSFALMLAKQSKAEIARARGAAPPTSSGSSPYLDRYPRQLSGGQRQRVAMGRAIVRDPQVFLFDEPLSNLDAKLRVQMRTEIKELHQRLKTTSIYVTHDQIEAMTMADKIVVMRDGIVEQTGDPLDALRPAGQHVRRRLHRLAGDEHHPGHRARNGGGGRRSSSATACALPVPRGARADDGQAVLYGMRPEHCALTGDGGLPAEVVVVEPTGADTQLYCRFNGQEVTSIVARPRRLPPGRPRRPRARSCASAPVRRGERTLGSPLTLVQPCARQRSSEAPQPEEESMSEIKRREFLKAIGGRRRRHRARRRRCSRPRPPRSSGTSTPEKGAKLRVLRWKRFVQGDEDVWAANTKKFTEMTGIEVRVDAEGWEDVRPKAAVAANVGSGPDIIISTMDDAHQYPDKLVDVTDLANYLGDKYGGWYRSARVPTACTARTLDRRSDGRCRQRDRLPRKPRQGGGLRRRPEGHGRLPEAVPGAEGEGHAGGLRARQRDRRLDTWTHWLVWAHGGKLVDAKNNVVIDSPETIAGARVREAALRDVHPRHAVVARPEQQQGVPRRPDLAHRNGISIYYAAKTSPDPKLQEMADDIQHANFPIGPVGKPTRAQPRSSPDDLQVLEVSERGEGIPALHDGEGAVRAVAGGVDRLRVAIRCGLRVEPDLDEDPKNTPYRDCMKNMPPTGYAGEMGYASAARSRTSSSSTWSRRRRRARRRRRKRRSGRRSGRSATTRYDVAPLRRRCDRTMRRRRDVIPARVGAVACRRRSTRAAPCDRSRCLLRDLGRVERLFARVPSRIHRCP